MSPTVTLQSLPILLWLGGFTYFLPAVILACILLLVPALRRNRITRAIGIVFAIIAALFPISGMVVLLQFGSLMASKTFSEAHRTYHLSAPRTLAGIAFPAGSTVELDQYDPHFIETATVPSPTPVRGFSLIGQFSMSSPASSQPAGDPQSLNGTLAQPATIHGIPCTAAAININSTFTSCILARQLELHGFTLAAGTFVQTRQQPTGDFLLEQGTLALPTTLFGVLYPAGTILTPDAASAKMLADLSSAASGLMVICLPPAGEITLGGATLHGPLALSYSDTVQVNNHCQYTSAGQPLSDQPSVNQPLGDQPLGDQGAAHPSSPGFGQAGPIHFLEGTYDLKTGSWTGLYNTETPDMTDPGQSYTAPAGTPHP